MGTYREDDSPSTSERGKEVKERNKIRGRKRVTNGRRLYTVHTPDIQSAEYMQKYTDFVLNVTEFEI